MQLETVTADMIAARAQRLAIHALDMREGIGLVGSSTVRGAEREQQVEEGVLHLRSLSDAILGASEQLFVDYVDWARTSLAARSMPPDYLTSQLISLRGALYDEFPEAVRVAETYLAAALARLSSPALEQASFVAPQTLAARYLERLLAYDRVGALAVVRSALDAGTSVRDVYLEVVQEVQHEIGRLWQLNRISVAQEHYCTAVSQLVLAQLYPRLVHGPGGPRMVATCATDELHELGARMVADFFEMDGWDTTYIGANTPTRDLVDELRKRRPALLAISATMGFHLHAVRALVAQVRESADLRDIKILVGGRPFSVEGRLWQRLGADACAADAQQAVAAGRTLLGLPRAAERPS